MSALVLLTAAGCADGGSGPTAARAAAPGASGVVSGPPWYDEVAPARAAGTVGAGRSACQLPITFSVPARWVAEPVDDGSAMTLGGSRLRCEVDAKPAGNVGFLRVWAAEEGTLDVRASLEDFLAEHGRVSEIEYRHVRRGPLDLVEATYLQRNELSGGPNRQRALAAQTPGGAILLTFGGMDTGEFEAMFPAYQLATSTVRATTR
ncbi:lipoprotein [Micromonospora sp. DT233]|uniref:lipoprotein n=1 Tax=Micromonospora sp. DT233 TaxID=3393432 RepID=UPI003CE7C93E